MRHHEFPALAVPGLTTTHIYMYNFFGCRGLGWGPLEHLEPLSGDALRQGPFQLPDLPCANGSARGMEALNKASVPQCRPSNFLPTVLTSAPTPVLPAAGWQRLRLISKAFALALGVGAGLPLGKDPTSEKCHGVGLSSLPIAGRTQRPHGCLHPGSRRTTGLPCIVESRSS